ncbi:MAG: hypothetical protein LVR00_02755 [Rhabdochlamydiaceae bacterium]|jgi:hypothetical protein
MHASLTLLQAAFASAYTKFFVDPTHGAMFGPMGEDGLPLEISRMGASVEAGDTVLAQQAIATLSGIYKATITAMCPLHTEIAAARKMVFEEVFPTCTASVKLNIAGIALMTLGIMGTTYFQGNEKKWSRRVCSVLASSGIALIAYSTYNISNMLKSSAALSLIEIKRMGSLPV